jgi:hypothetical protein
MTFDGTCEHPRKLRRPALRLAQCHHALRLAGVALLWALGPGFGLLLLPTSTSEVPGAGAGAGAGAGDGWGGVQSPKFKARAHAQRTAHNRRRRLSSAGPRPASFCCGFGHGHESACVRSRRPADPPTRYPPPPSRPLAGPRAHTAEPCTGVSPPPPRR